MSVRCPRCGTPVDAEAVTYRVPAGGARRLAEHLEIVRRELGLASDGEALLAAARRQALHLNQRG